MLYVLEILVVTNVTNQYSYSAPGIMQTNESVAEKEREREIECDFFYFLKVHLGDSNRQPQSSRENPKTKRAKSKRLG